MPAAPPEVTSRVWVDPTPTLRLLSDLSFVLLRKVLAAHKATRGAGRLVRDLVGLRFRSRWGGKTGVEGCVACSKVHR